MQKFQKENLTEINSNNAPSSTVAKELSAYFDILGTFYHLSCNFKEAVNTYKASVALDGENIESAIKLAQIYIELGDVDGAEQIFDTLSRTQEGVNLAWSLTHQASLFISRKKDGGYREEGVTKASAAVDK